MGRPGRFPNAEALKAFTGLTPWASQTGTSDRKGQFMTKAGPRRLRDQLVMSANAARRLDPELACGSYWDFPLPSASLASGRVWKLDVEAWAAAHNSNTDRRPGRRKQQPGQDLGLARRPPSITPPVARLHHPWRRQGDRGHRRRLAGTRARAARHQRRPDPPSRGFETLRSSSISTQDCSWRTPATTPRRSAKA